MSTESRRLIRDQPAANALLITSPLAFFFPIYVAELLGYTAYSQTLQFVVATSFWYHSTYSKPAFLLDQLAIAATEVVALLSAWQADHFSILVFLSINAYTGYVYFYGKITRTLAFDQDMFTQSWFHASIHYLAALAHVIILHRHSHLTPAI